MNVQCINLFKSNLSLSEEIEYCFHYVFCVVFVVFSYRPRHYSHSASFFQRPTPRLSLAAMALWSFYSCYNKWKLAVQFVEWRRRRIKIRGSHSRERQKFYNAIDLRKFSTSTKVIRSLANVYPDLLAVTETWCTEESGDLVVQSIYPRDYTALQKPRDILRETNVKAVDL